METGWVGGRGRGREGIRIGIEGEYFLGGLREQWKKNIHKKLNIKI
jgi:hypothetical protein